ncbi:MAG: PIG-L family deacetylase [Acidobacteria bacterium]|nr:PIG-L family deacetylase [Acidobacteriota bacterium]
MPAPTNLRVRSLLAVLAHPDDESIACGGLLAWCAHLGVDVSLLCMTRGEHGRGSTAGSEKGTLRSSLCVTRDEHGESPGEVARKRRRELEAAARALGIGAVTLLDHEDGMLPWLAAGPLRSEIEGAIRVRRPEVVVTFDADGLYWHPDHIAVHELTTAAVMALRDDAPALYYVTMPSGSMRAVADHAAETLRGGAANEPPSGGASDPGRRRDSTKRRPPSSILGVADPDAFGSGAPAPTLVVDAGVFATRKLAALACHASQFRDSALAYVTEQDAPRLLGIEHYRRAAAGAAGRTFLEDLGSPPEPFAGPRHAGDRPPGGGRTAPPC